MRLSRGTTATTDSASFGSAMSLSASTHSSEGTTFMVRQHSTEASSRDVAIQRGGASPGLTNLRSFATAGAVLLGAGFVVFTPPSVGHVPGFATQRDITLTAGDTLPDLLAPWIDQFNTASANTTALTNAFFDAPGVAWQQMVANMSGYLQDFFNDPTSNTVTSISAQMQDNLAAVLTGFGLQNADAATTATVLSHTLEGGLGELGNGHGLLFGEIPGYLPADEASTITPIINFLASPASGILMGNIGPFISPLIALGNSISAGDSFNEILANMSGAFFNGATLNLDSLLPTINGSGYFPAGMTMENLDIGFGGLLSPGGVGADADGVGGSIFNSVGFDFTGVPVIKTIDAPSEPVGPLGAWEGWAQTIAALLGWDGSGSPLATVDFPIIPDDGGAAAAAVADVSSWLQDLTAAL